MYGFIMKREESSNVFAQKPYVYDYNSYIKRINNSRILHFVYGNKYLNCGLYSFK